MGTKQWIECGVDSVGGEAAKIPVLPWDEDSSEFESRYLQTPASYPYLGGVQLNDSSPKAVFRACMRREILPSSNSKSKTTCNKTRPRE